MRPSEFGLLATLMGQPRPVFSREYLLDRLQGKPPADRCLERTNTALAIAGGDLAQQVPVRSDDEIGLLAAQFNRMSADLVPARQLREDLPTCCVAAGARASRAGGGRL